MYRGPTHRDAATPKACHTPTNIPLHWQQWVYDDLLRDGALGVMERVPYGEPVTWCHRMVITRKHDGSPRRTVDISPLNKFCQREAFTMESPFQLARRIPKDTRDLKQSGRQRQGRLLLKNEISTYN